MYFKGQIGIGFLWIVFILLLSFWISAYLIFAILPLFPINNTLTSQGITAIINYMKWTYAFIDNSFYVLFVLVLFIGLYDSYENPSKKKAIIDLIGLFVLGYFNLAISGIL